MRIPYSSRRRHAVGGAFALLLATAIIARGSAAAQAPADNVHWTVAVVSEHGALVAGSDVTVEISGAIDDGWHVYGLQQLPGGPIPLRVALDANDTAFAAGSPVESPTQKIHDSRFGLDTQFHTRTVQVRLPVRIAAGISGNRSIPVSVRFQLCSEGECKPPRTVHLAASLEVAPNA